MCRFRGVLGSVWTIALLACGGGEEGSGGQSSSTEALDGTEAAPSDDDDEGDPSGDADAESGLATSEAEGPGADSTSTDESGVATTSDADSTSTTPGSDDRSDVTDGEPAAGTIDVTLSGCAIDFGGEIFVAYNGSLGVASIYQGGGQLSGSFQFDLDGPATFVLSTQQRIDTGTIINMVDPAQGTWTNIDPDGAVPDGNDSISGVLDVSVWTPSEGLTAIEFDNVTLYNTTTGNVCTINGRIETDHLSV